MAIITYGDRKTNVEPGTSIYKLLTEINGKLGSESLIILQETHTSGIWKKRKVSKYRAYWDLGNGEYQVIVAAIGDEQVISAYLIGILTGLETLRKGQEE